MRDTRHVSRCLISFWRVPAWPHLLGNVPQVSPPVVRTRAPLQLLVTNLDYDEHKGRICIGRVTSGKISKAESIAIAKPGALIVAH